VSLDTSCVHAEDCDLCNPAPPAIDIATARELAQQTMIATSALLASATAPGAPPLPPEVLLELATAERHACLSWAALYRAHAALDPAEAARQAEGRAFAAALEVTP